MDASKLRRNLRTAGLDRIGRDLPGYLLEQGVPCMRVGHGLQLRIEQDQTGRLRALALGRDGWLVVADEERAHMDREALRLKLRPKPEAGKVVSSKVPVATIKRARRYLAGTGLTLSGLLAVALESYLRERGA